jgi:hypothetical protein
VETLNSQIIHSLFFGIETCAADTDFHQFLIRIVLMKICMDSGILRVAFAIPCIGRTFSIPALIVRFGMEYFVERFLFVKRFIVQKYLAGMMYSAESVEPVAVNAAISSMFRTLSAADGQTPNHGQ